MGMERAHPADALGEEEHDKHCVCRQCFESRRAVLITTSRSTVRPPRIRQVVIDGRTMYAVSAHELLDASWEIGRPGMPY